MHLRCPWQLTFGLFSPRPLYVGVYLIGFTVCTAGFCTGGPILILSSVWSLSRLPDNSYSTPSSPNRPTDVDIRINLLHVTAGLRTTGPILVLAPSLPFSLLHNSPRFNASYPSAADNSGVLERKKISLPLPRLVYRAGKDKKQGYKSLSRVSKLLRWSA